MSSSTPVSTVNEIKERTQHVFRLSEFQHIAWVGVFGSFSRGKQNPESDVDLLVGLKEGTSSNDFWYIPASLQEKLQESLRREVDLLYLHHGQVLSFIKAQALVAAQTIYDADMAWVSAQQSQSKTILVDAYVRFTEALRLEKQSSDAYI
ncbi:hypothetical protein B0I35DRAFT_481573 [Stachybotrys elegans]|uniref:Polymerase beta nucleotidyltransferase domain-containing protein n=1 Tax=Stachybotrys elegans TaxID=80388 RepID=A0A8K0WPV2_9HYPO|nr:hypothetical protein B0I35DRAFT_481573 [Stachybotrys elegans]